MPFLLAVDFFDYVTKFLHKSHSSSTGKDSQVIWVLQEMDYGSTHGPSIRNKQGSSYIHKMSQ